MATPVEPPGGIGAEGKHYFSVWQSLFELDTKYVPVKPIGRGARWDKESLREVRMSGEGTLGVRIREEFSLVLTQRYENKEYVLDEQIPIIDNDSTQEEIEAHQKHYDDANKVSCIMASSMSLELQKTFENTWAYEEPQLKRGDPKEAVCFYCNTKGHWKRSCPKYLNDLKDEKVEKGGHSASPCKGIYETVECIDNGNVILNVGSSNELDKSKLWHSRLGHINKKRIAQLQKDGVLESFDFKSDDVCESCLLGKMTKSPFTRTCERGEGLLDLVHTDVCGPFRSATKDGKCYYVTFTDDFSRYGYVYLIKHKSANTIEMFKRYQNEVENQLGKKIKVLRSDRGGEYLSIKFFDHLKNCGIVSQQLSPISTHHKTEWCCDLKRNRTLLDMVRSMMCQATLLISFWGYALETAAHILNLVLTKKVSKTPFEMWKEIRFSLGTSKSGVVRFSLDEKLKTN
ncbi:retrotransposon protein, putative, ty1-copia subclass [Tanacetum coccineum]